MGSAMHPRNRSPGGMDLPEAAPGRSHAWLARYAVRRLQVHPSMPVCNVIQCAAASYPYCADLEPEEAAGMHARASLVCQVGPSSIALSSRFAER